MPASSRSRRSARSNTRITSGPRWLCSRMPIPDESKSHSAPRARLSAISGNTAGPGEKLKTRSVKWVSCSGSREVGELEAKDVGAAAGDVGQLRRAGGGGELDARARRLVPFVEHVLHLLDVD